MDIPARRQMEDFFVNSTSIKTCGPADHRIPETRRPTRGRQNVSFDRTSVDMFAMATATASTDASDVHRKASVQTTFTDPLDEQLYYRGYASDEEAASPADVESDAESITSVSSGEIVQARPARSSLTFPDGVILSNNAAERQCLRARAVNLEPIGVGRPRRVSLVDIPASPFLQRTSPRSPVPMRLANPRLQKINTSQPSPQNRSNASDISTPRTSTDKSPTSTPSTPATSGDEDQFFSSRSIRRMPSIPAMRATYIPSSRSDFDLDHLEKPTARCPTQSNFAPHVSQTASDSSVPTRRRLHKTASSSFARSHRDVSIYRASSDTFSIAPEVYIPRRPSVESEIAQPDPRSRTISKMLPRGANERAPPLVLPPYPDDNEDDEGRGLEKKMGLKREGRVVPKSYEPTGAPPHISRAGARGKLHKKMRSVSHQGVFAR